MQPLSRGEGRRQEGARLDMFAKCGILFLFILTGLPGAAGLQKEMSSMKYAFDNANLIDGTKDMCVQPGLCVLTDGGTITDIVPAGTAPAGYTRIDLRGRYLLPGLINMHVHLAGSGKIQKKQRDNEKLVRRILSNPVSPALPYALFDRSVTHLTEVEQFNGNVVFEGMVACAKAALAHDIPIALGNDVGCQWIAQYDFWRELCYFHKYTGASNACALYCATGQAARLAGLGGVTGTLAPGMSADMIVAAGNPLDDLRVLRTLDMVVARGRVIDRPKVRRNAQLDAGLDPLLA